MSVCYAAVAIRSQKFVELRHCKVNSVDVALVNVKNTSPIDFLRYCRFPGYKNITKPYMQDKFYQLNPYQ